MTVTTIADVTPPSFVTGYPTPSVVKDFEFSLEVALNEPGTWYWVVVPFNASAPSTSQVRARTDGSGNAAIAGDSGTLGQAGVAVTARVFGTGLLAAETTYDVYVFAEDDEPTPNQQAVVTHFNVTTTKDVTPPLYHTAPAITSVTDFTLTLAAALDEPGGFHYVVVPDFSSRPSVAEAVAGLDSLGNPALLSGFVNVTSKESLTSVEVPLQGIRHPTSGVCCVLSASTTFEVWFVGEVRTKDWSFCRRDRWMRVLLARSWCGCVVLCCAVLCCAVVM